MDADPTPKNITYRLEKVTQNYGPFHDASGYFGLFELSIGRKDKKFEVFLEKPLLGNFQAGDQFNLAIVVHNGKETSKLEVYGRIEEARDKSLQPNDLTTSSTTPFPTPKTTTPTSTSSPILSTTPVAVNTTTCDDLMKQTIIVTVVPIFAVLGSGMVLLACFWKKLLEHFRKCMKKKKKPEFEKTDVNNVLSNETELTTVSNSRKTSTASFFGSETFSNAYESDIVNTKESLLDPWEFPR